MCSWFVFSVNVENCKWIICSSFFYYIVKVYVFCYWIRRASIKFLFRSSFVSFSNNFSISMLVIPFPQVIIHPRTLQEDYWTSLWQCLVVKSFLLFCFLFYLFLSYIAVVHSLWIFLTYCWIISYFFKTTEKSSTSLPLSHWSSFSTFWCCSSFIYSFHCNIRWEMRPWYSFIFSIKSSTVGNSHFFDAASLLIA